MVKKSGVAAVLSFLIPGLGQIYNGQIIKGIQFIVISVILSVLTIILIGFILYPIFWIYTIIDAYNVGGVKKTKRRRKR